MKKTAAIRVIHLLAALFVIASLAGCTSVAPATSAFLGLHGEPPAHTQTQTTVNLSQGNFVVVKTNAMGSSKGFTLLGLIPIYPAKLTTAMDRLYAQAGDREGKSKSVAHLLVERSRTYWLLFSIPEVTVRADIVEFNPKAAAPGSLTNSPAAPP